MQKKLILKGLGVSSGNAQGHVVLIIEGSDFLNFKNGDVLVAEMTDPTMVVMMSKAAAIVTNTGGLTCHAAIVSREMGIPCVVATKTATEELKNGAEIFVDGDAGEVYLISK